MGQKKVIVGITLFVILGVVGGAPLRQTPGDVGGSETELVIHQLSRHTLSEQLVWRERSRKGVSGVPRELW